MKKIYFNLLTCVAMIFVVSNTTSAQDVANVDSLSIETTVVEELEDGNGEMPTYRRSSIYTVLIKHPTLPHGDAIDSVFMSLPVPDKFNNHDIEVKSFQSTAKKAKRRGKKKDASNSKDITEFIQANKIPNQLVAKWFNRCPTTGGFDLELIYERGLYDASQDAISKADNDLYGRTALKDSGTDLIGKTFMMINDITFSDTGEKTKKIGGWMKLLGEVAAEATGNEDIATISNAASVVVNEVDGFGVNITSHLYCLDWCNETLDTFYTNMWYDESSIDEVKRQAFDTTSLFNLKYIGEITTTARNISSKSFAQRSKEEQLIKVCARAIDKSIVDLQREYDEFKVNVPVGKIYDDGTVDVAIGLKEGLTEKSEYEVLMRVEGEDKKITYDRIGKITPIAGKIWDNRFGALDEYNTMLETGEKVNDPEGKEGNPTLITSTFKILSGKSKISSGCLVREVTIKR